MTFYQQQFGQWPSESDSLVRERERERGRERERERESERERERDVTPFNRYKSVIYNNQGF